MRRLPILLAGSVLAITGCAPEGVPWQSERHWSLKNGFHFTWTREIESGCASWMAMERWVRVRFYIGLPCAALGEGSYSDAKGFDYNSTEDMIVLYGYWPWSDDIFADRIVFDDEGMWADTLPCPHVLEAKDVDAITAAASKLLQSDLTPRERRVIERINARLKVLVPDALASSQFGCSDRADDPKKRAALGKSDPWDEPEDQVAR